MSQSDLARTLGITFQQVQKYERGSNRVSVGKLYRLAEILDVPLTFFFDGLDLPSGNRPHEVVDGGEPGQSSILSRRELDLLRAWKTAPPDISDAVASLLRAVAGSEPLDGIAAPADGVVEHAAKSQIMAETAPRPAPARRGRPPKAAAAAAPAGGRRRRGAVWDPSDIEKAAKPGGAARPKG